MNRAIFSVVMAQFVFIPPPFVQYLESRQFVAQFANTPKIQLLMSLS
jgi:hypothetical protein